MTAAIKVMESLIKIQEHASTIRHGCKEAFSEISLAEVHCIDWIARLANANVTRIAAKMGMTRGAISKINKKLLEKELIESYKAPGNNKEIYYKLTPAGQRLYNEHKKRHLAVKQEKLSVIEKYNKQEQSIILRFLSDMNHLADRRKVQCRHSSV